MRRFLEDPVSKIQINMTVLADTREPLIDPIGLIFTRPVALQRSSVLNGQVRSQKNGNVHTAIGSGSSASARTRQQDGLDAGTVREELHNRNGGIRVFGRGIT